MVSTECGAVPASVELTAVWSVECGVWSVGTRFVVGVIYINMDVSDVNSIRDSEYVYGYLLMV